jgi:hypothetical protein
MDSPPALLRYIINRMLNRAGIISNSISFGPKLRNVNYYIDGFPEWIKGAEENSGCYGYGNCDDR